MSAARVVALLTVLSRIFGLARDAVCSRVFGASPVWSAFALAFLLPNLFRRLFGEGALSAALIPEYSRLIKGDPLIAARFASAVLGLTLLTLSVFALLGEVLLLALLLWSPLGQSGGLTIRLAMVMLPYLVLICATGAIGGILQTHGRFSPTAAAPIILNTCIITAASIWAWRLDAPLETTAFVVAWSVLLAGLIQFGWPFVELRKHIASPGRLAELRAPIGRMLRGLAPVIIGLAALQLNTLVDGLIAGWPVLVGDTIRFPWRDYAVAYPLDGASNAVLFFAQRLYQFPLGVFGIALATAAFPAMARVADDNETFRQTLHRGLRLAFYIGLPASVGLVAVRYDIVSVILEGGAFGDADTQRVATTLMGYAPAIWAYTITHILTRAFYALNDTKTPMRTALLSVACNLPLNFVLIWPLREAGLAWSTAICAAGQALLLAIILHRRIAGAFDGDCRRSIARTFVSTVVMSGGLFLLWILLPEPAGWGEGLLRLLLLVGCGGVTFFGTSVALRMPEARWLLQR